VDEEIKKGASFQSEKETRQPHSRTPKKERMHPEPKSKVISFDERAKEEKAVFGAITEGRSQTFHHRGKAACGWFSAQGSAGR
jgi:hypothetical protein